jgi:hypothetical protein
VLLKVVLYVLFHAKDLSPTAACPMIMKAAEFCLQLQPDYGFFFFANK